MAMASLWVMVAERNRSTRLGVRINRLEWGRFNFDAFLCEILQHSIALAHASTSAAYCAHGDSRGKRQKMQRGDQGKTKGKNKTK